MVRRMQRTKHYQIVITYLSYIPRCLHWVLVHHGLLDVPWWAVFHFVIRMPQSVGMSTDKRPVGMTSVAMWAVLLPGWRLWYFHGLVFTTWNVGESHYVLLIGTVWLERDIRVVECERYSALAAVQRHHTPEAAPWTKMWVCWVWGSKGQEWGVLGRGSELCPTS